MNKYKVITLCITALVLIFIGWSLDWPILSKIQRISCEKDYSLVNKTIACGGSDVIKKTGYTKTRLNMVDYVEKSKADGTITNASVYFRDLEHGPTFGVNEYEVFAPASLLKLPLAIMYIKINEAKPGLLTHSVVYTIPPEGVAPQPFSPSKNLEVGKSYSLETLIFHTLVYSDNRAAEILISFIDKVEHGSEIFDQTFQELGVARGGGYGDESVSVRGYASLFLLLYNISYLNPESSEKVLTLLTKVDVDKGLVNGVPAGVQVAHKFGTRGFSDDTKQFHDCGIVYYPGNPYLLCVMSRGHDWDQLAGFVAEVSRMMYEEVDSRRL